MARDISILVVDDELIVIKSAERVLQAEGFNVEGALGGAEAMSKIGQSHYDLVFTDLKMPDIDGLTLIKWIKKFKPSIGIVVITGYPSQDTMKEALELGIIDYVPKPFTPSVLIDVAERAVTWIKGKKPEEVEKAEDDFPPSMAAELDRVIAEYRKKAGSLIPILQRAQEIVGYLPPVVQKRISKKLQIPAAEIHSVVSFYSFFTMKPRGDHNLRICLGTACYVKGIEGILAKIEDVLKIGIGDTTEDKKFSLEGVRCLGACGLAPVMVIDQETYGALTQGKALQIINQYDPGRGAKSDMPAEEMAEKEA